VGDSRFQPDTVRKVVQCATVPQNAQGVAYAIQRELFRQLKAGTGVFKQAKKAPMIAVGLSSGGIIGGTLLVEGFGLNPDSKNFKNFNQGPGLQNAKKRRRASFVKAFFGHKNSNLFAPQNILGAQAGLPQSFIPAFEGCPLFPEDYLNTVNFYVLVEPMSDYISLRASATVDYNTNSKR